MAATHQPEVHLLLPEKTRTRIDIMQSQCHPEIGKGWRMAFETNIVSYPFSQLGVEQAQREIVLRITEDKLHIPQSILVILLLFFLIRPLGVFISTIGKKTIYPHRQKFYPQKRWIFGWFGIRGVGSLYYLAYALSSGLKGDLAEQISWITYTTVVVSVLVHGISATPSMNWYNKNIASKIKTSISEN